MLWVNTIEFNGEKAVINSYSDHPALKSSMETQFATWHTAYPNAKVLCERMSEDDCRALVAKYPDHIAAYRIGQTSRGAGQ